MNREEVIEFEKSVQLAGHNAEVIVFEALGKMTEAGVGPASAVATMALQAFNHLDQAPVESQFDFIEMVKKKLVLHLDRLKAEGHDTSEYT